MKTSIKHEQGALAGYCFGMSPGLSELTARFHEL